MSSVLSTFATRSLDGKDHIDQDTLSELLANGGPPSNFCIYRAVRPRLIPGSLPSTLTEDQRGAMAAVAGCSDVDGCISNVSAATKELLCTKYDIALVTLRDWWKNAINRKQLGMPMTRKHAARAVTPPWKIAAREARRAATRRSRLQNAALQAARAREDAALQAARAGQDAATKTTRFIMDAVIQAARAGQDAASRIQAVRAREDAGILAARTMQDTAIQAARAKEDAEIQAALAKEDMISASDAEDEMDAAGGLLSLADRFVN